MSIKNTNRIQLRKKYLIFVVPLLVISGLFASLVTYRIGFSSSVSACTSLPSDYGSVTQTVNIPLDGNYTVWSRIMAPDDTNNSYYLEVNDSNCSIVVGDGQFAPNTWTWVDYRDGSSATKIEVNLTAGTHTVKMVGREEGVLLDRVLFVSDSCQPVETGDNCVPDTISPKVSLTHPNNGATVRGSVLISADASDEGGIEKIEFLIDGIVAGEDTVEPYDYTWDTTTMADGQHSLSAKAYDTSGNVATSTVASVTVNQDYVPTRTSNGLIALYTFTESSGTTVQDVSGVGSPLDLTINDASKVNWIPDSNGVVFNVAGGAISSQTAATKITTAQKASNKATIEAWVKPANITQSGPARIATISEGVNNNQINIHLGQAAAAATNRIRTSPSLTNTLNANSVFVTANELVHVVITYDGGTQKVYRNGVLMPESSSPNVGFANFVDTYPLVLGNEASLDRSWLGEMYLVAFYDRDLTAAEVTGNFDASFDYGSGQPDPQDNEPPSISISAPANGETVSGNATISADADDNIGVSKVEFFVGSTLIGTDTSSPYSLSWDSTSVDNGEYTLEAKAYDTSSNVALSAGVNVTVSNTSLLPEDINLDGIINILDFSLLASRFGQSGSGLGREDINGDGIINILDFSLLASRFGT